MPDRPEFDGLDPELIGRYLAGESSEDETAQVRRWLMANPDAARRLDAYLAALDHETARPPAPDVDAEWGALQARIHAHAPRDAAPAVPRPPAAATVARAAAWWRRGRALAAAGVVLAAG